MASTDRNVANGEDKAVFSLRRERGLASSYLYLFQEFWCPGIAIEVIYSDVVVASFPKTGTTWLIALTFAIVNRQNFSAENHPLLTSNPHRLVSCLEFKIFCDDIHDPVLHLSNMIEPRLFSTHTSFTSLPKSLIESNAKIIYICRNPFDTFISAWTYFNKIRSTMSLPALELEEAFEMYCNGIVSFGPWWSHMLGFWKESLVRPNKVIFLKYEDLKENVNFHLKKNAEFLECPFTAEEESDGVIESIIKLCSFEKMKDLEVNISGKLDKIIDNTLQENHHIEINF